ncbi:DUF1214 domain-containing protein [Microbulbifer agarilyticus]
MRKDIPNVLIALVLSGLVSLCVAQDTPDPVTEETFIRAEVDARILRFQDAGGLNQGLVYSVPTPLDNQAVPRMNRDTLYAGIPIDTKDGFRIEIPESPANRYFSVYLLDNDHYTIDILRKPGTYEFGAQDTRYIVAIPRVQIFDATDEADIETAREILANVKVDSGSKVPKKANWDWDEMLRLRSLYDRKLSKYSQYPPSFQDTRKSGKTDPEEHRIAVASSWGLFPDYETVYIADRASGATDHCYRATYQVPENQAFWSITMYNGEGYMFSENAALNDSNTKMNDDGTFTAYYGSKAVCGDVPNRLDTAEGWNILMRVYRPGKSVRAGDYILPEITKMGLRKGKKSKVVED